MENIPNLICVNAKKAYCLTGIFVLSMILPGCTEGFLDVKPDKQMVVPNSLENLSALLRSDGDLNNRYPDIGIIASDNLYVDPTTWSALPYITAKNAYIWGDDVFNDRDDNDWSYPYIKVFYANVVLESLESIDPNTRQQKTWDNLKGSALFFRAYAFYHLSQVFAQPFKKTTASTDLGIPLRLSPDPNKKSVRSTVRETYDRIVLDANRALRLLPIRPDHKNNPSKPAAYGLLARTYLSMGDYQKAGQYADSCLQVSNTLLDFNTLDTTAQNPIPMFNDEVVFHSLMIVNSGFFSRHYYRVDSNLYKLYAETDLRKQIYFEAAPDSGYVFLGSYSGRSRLFNGITAGEMYLIKAECEARQGNTDVALGYLNELLAKRYQAEEFVPLTTGLTEKALITIIMERRKELAFRGLRWTDLRRLNLEPRFAKTLKREINGRLYELPPNDPRYTFPIPQKVIDLSEMPQNPR